MDGVYALLADVLVIVHFLYVAFVVTGELLIIIGGIRNWSWIRRITFRLLHLAAIVVVAIQTVLGRLCPLTIWEYQLREAAGQQAEWDMTFVGRLFRTLLYYDFPDWAFTTLYIGFTALVVITLILFPPRRKQW
ncbi:MAG: DUF2784 domain-containing protein [Spirochaetota bacterium]